MVRLIYFILRTLLGKDVVLQLRTAQGGIGGRVVVVPWQRQARASKVRQKLLLMYLANSAVEMRQGHVAECCRMLHVAPTYT